MFSDADFRNRSGSLFHRSGPANPKAAAPIALFGTGRTSTSTDDFPEMYLSTFQVLYKLYLSTDVLKYKVLLPGSALYIYNH